MRRKRRVAQGPAAQSRPASWRKIERSRHAVGRKTRMRAAPSITRAAILIRRRRSVELRNRERRALYDRIARGEHEPIGGGVQDQPELVGLGIATRGAV